MIPAIVLAAGKSSRMGRPKALLPIGSSGDTFLTRILRVLRDGGITRAVVVIGGDAAAVRAALPSADDFLRIVENEDYEQGQLSSLLVGLSAVEQGNDDVEGVMVTLVDLPLISEGTVRAVIDAYRNASGTPPIVRPRRGSRHGHPAIFDRRLFAELRNADPSAGAKPVVRAHAAEEVNVDVADDGAFTDIDTPEDYERFIAPTLNRATETSRATEPQSHRET
jgi:CTP:molybdopterin cytidylyltransferase MocA